MRACFAFVIGVAVAVVGTAEGGEVSVLNHGVSTPAVVVAAPAPAAVIVESAAPARVTSVEGQCQNGQCSRLPRLFGTVVGPRVYGVETYESAGHRHRLFGGTVTRSSARTVVRPARR